MAPVPVTIRPQTGTGGVLRALKGVLIRKPAAPSRPYSSPILSPEQVTRILRSKEMSRTVQTGPVKGFETSSLGSNSPCEDSLVEARCRTTNGFLFGIFDGHGGPDCARAVAARISSYISTSLEPTAALEELLRANQKDSSPLLVEQYTQLPPISSSLEKLYNFQLLQFAKDLSGRDQTDINIRRALQRAFLKLDDDLGREAKAASSPGNGLGLGKAEEKKAIRSAVSGCVSAVVLVAGREVHVAFCGDVEVVVGSRHEQGDQAIWTATKLTRPHNVDNSDEVERLTSAHPAEEHLFHRGRLLGSLTPLRAFGDVQFKWSGKDVDKFLSAELGSCARLEPSLSPPYVTARPEVKRYELKSNDKFLIIGSDGLWERLSASRAVKIVGNHLMRTRTDGQVDKVDENGATCLIRNSLSSSLDNEEISQLLTMSKKKVRRSRDDITVTVVYLDENFLQRSV